MLLDDIHKLIQEVETNKFEVPHKSGLSKLKTNIAPEDRSLKNLPRDAKGKSKVRFQDWLGISGDGCNGPKGYDERYYGWSHRAIHGFKVGDEIKPDTIGYEGDGKSSYILKTEDEAKQHAIRFGKDVS